MKILRNRDRIAEAVALREAGQVEQSRALLLALLDETPDDPIANLQCAWAHDKLGLESEAVPFYEAALGLGLEDDDRRHALLGLGSTYRTLGRYEEALATLTRGVEEFPGDNGILVFQAMAFYNTGQAKDACELLLRIILETSSDEAIRSYESAIGAYAADLDRTWP
jgi:tetratricopeptide (TPR) repeat protein